jgi:hypothetical protein
MNSNPGIQSKQVHHAVFPIVAPGYNKRFQTHYLTTAAYSEMCLRVFSRP